MPRTPDPDRSRAVLLGTHTCDGAGLPPVPQISGNLGGLKDALCDREVGFFLPAHCETIEQPSREKALRTVTRLGRQAADTLLVYYGGHAVPGQRSGDSLLLSMADSGEEAWSFLQIDDLKDAIHGSPARFKILVLDCCYAGVAIAGRLGVADESRLLAVQASMSGLYTLASSGAGQRSLAPRGSTYTTFTGALIKTLLTGIADGHEFIDLHRLYQELRLALAGPYPKPAQQNTGEAADLAIVRNRAYRPVGRAGGPDAAYLSYLEEVVGDGLDLETRLDAVDRIARRARTEDSFLQVLRMITEAPEAPVLLRINVAWRLDLLGDEAGAVNGLDQVLDGGGAKALERLRALLTIGEPAADWPEISVEDEDTALRPVRLDRLSDEQLWGRLMAMVLLAAGLPVGAMLDAVEELAAGPARLLLDGLLRVAPVEIREEVRVEGVLRGFSIPG